MGGNQPYKQKMSSKMTSADKVSSKSSSTDKYSKHTSQDTYSKKNNAGEKYSSVKKTSCDKYSAGPAGEKYTISKKTSEDKYSKSSGMDTHLKTKVSSKDTYVKGNEDSKKKSEDTKKKSEDKAFKSSDNQKTFTSSSSSKAPSDKKDKLFCEKETKSGASVHTATWTSRPYEKEQKTVNKDDRNRGLGAFGSGAIAGVGVLAAAGPRKRNDERERDNKRNNGHNNGGTDRDDRRYQYNNESHGDTADNGCCVLL